MTEPRDTHRTPVPPLPSDEMVRLERRNLLGIAVLSFAVAFAGVVPEKLAMLGVTLESQNQARLVLLLAAVQAYFTIALFVYGHAERRALAAQFFRQGIPAELDDWQSAVHGGDSSEHSIERFQESLEQRARRLEQAAQIAAGRRALIHYIVPLVIGTVAVGSLVYRAWSLHRPEPPSCAIKSSQSGSPSPTTSSD